MIGKNKQKIPVRDQIVRCSEELFSKNGYHDTSVRSITEKLAMNSATIHYYFQSKDGLLTAILADIYIELIAMANFIEREKVSSDKQISIYTDTSLINKQRIYLIGRLVMGNELLILNTSILEYMSKILRLHFRLYVSIKRKYQSKAIKYHYYGFIGAIIGNQATEINQVLSIKNISRRNSELKIYLQNFIER